jgi:hypothetical protein
MPIGKYFKGHGDEVMSNMKKEYGDKKGESIFYATANARKMKPKTSALDVLAKGTRKVKK